jgi:putative hydrolase of the HAD superfamily
VGRDGAEAARRERHHRSVALSLVVMSEPVTAVLFDFGGVFTLSPFEAVREAAAEHGLEPDTAFELCFGPYDRDGDHPWHCLERGEMSLADARHALTELARTRGVDLDPLSMLIRRGRQDEQKEAVVARALAVKGRGVRTACVTNNISEFGDAWRAMIPVDDLFDVVVDSCQVGFRKPDPRIFEMALAEVGAEAGGAVFLDDHPGNVAAAERLGIRGIVVGSDRLAAFDELEALLGR